MSTKQDWFSVNKDGLRQTHEPLIERSGYGVIGGELFQNVMDTTATECIFVAEKVRNKPRIQISVSDNGEGFQDLSHAWQMFAPSMKKDNPLLAGRFNIGEKMVLSFATSARIHTTSGTVYFDKKGRTEKLREKRSQGTLFEAELMCSSERYDQLINYMRRILVRPNLKLVVNDEIIPYREPLKSWKDVLSTQIGENLRSSRRKTDVQVHEVNDSEVAYLYELGIPVVETGDKWHVNVMQKVPLNKDRDNVTPAYLRSVRVTVLNNMFDKIESDDTESTWVNEATSDDRCVDEAAEVFRVKKYGNKSVALDPTNPEANAVAMSKGYTVIPSRGLSKGQRSNLKSAGTLLSTSQQFPRAGKGAYSDDPNANPVNVVPEERWSNEMKVICQYVSELGELLVDHSVTVRIVNCKSFVGSPWIACYGRGRFDFNLWKLGRKWFEKNLTPDGVTEAVDDLLIHELGHHYEMNHLSESYYNALTKIGAKLKKIAIERPDFFKQFTSE